MSIKLQEAQINSSMNVKNVQCKKPFNSGFHSCAPSFGSATVKTDVTWYKCFENKLVSKIFKFLPKKKTIEENSFFMKIVKAAEKFTTVHNRLFIGLVAFATQPWIDLFNPDVDSDTKKMSCLRTSAKIIIGTATGVAVRHACINWMLPKLTKVGKEFENNKLATLFMPSNEEAKKALIKSKSLLDNHRNVMGTFIAIAAMMITDPPLTLFLTNFFNKYFNTHKKVSDASKPIIEKTNSIEINEKVIQGEEVNNG